MHMHMHMLLYDTSYHKKHVHNLMAVTVSVAPPNFQVRADWADELSVRGQ